jgi:hypothetical protein
MVKGDHPDQVEAISALLRETDKNALRVVASTEVLGEIEKIPEQYQKRHLAVWPLTRSTAAGSPPTRTSSGADSWNTASDVHLNRDKRRRKGRLPGVLAEADGQR